MNQIQTTVDDTSLLRTIAMRCRRCGAAVLLAAAAFVAMPQSAAAAGLSEEPESPEAPAAVADDDASGAKGRRASRKPAGRQPSHSGAVREMPDSLEVGIVIPGEMPADSIGDDLPIDAPELVLAAPADEVDRWEEMERKISFNPDPTRAVWLSALFPGLGQLYNRRYWKLPLIVGGFMGLGYGASWNNTMLRDYTRAYADLLDSDPSTRSYMDFFPPNTQESQLDKEWLANLMRSRKNFYRRNRDLCIISMVGVYLLAIVDAYVDASLSHFDITPDLSMDVVPAMIPDTRAARPGLGLLWAVNF